MLTKESASKFCGSLTERYLSVRIQKYTMGTEYIDPHSFERLGASVPMNECTDAGNYYLSSDMRHVEQISKRHRSSNVTSKLCGNFWRTDTQKRLGFGTPKEPHL